MSRRWWWILGIGILVIGMVAAMPTSARAQDVVDPVATARAAGQAAQDAQWRANQAAGAAQRARETEAAAWGLATAQAQQATAQAAWAATATPAEATARALATRDALAAEGTRQAIFAESTRAAHEEAARATAVAGAQQATATRAAAVAEMDRLAVVRERAVQPFFTWGPWVGAGIVGVLVVLVVRGLMAGARDEGLGAGVSRQARDVDEGFGGGVPVVVTDGVQAVAATLTPAARFTQIVGDEGKGK